MKFLGSILIAAFLAQPVLAQNPNEAIDGHVIVLNEGVHIDAKAYYYNFGKVKVGRSATARFTVTNNGRIPFYIDSINTDGQGFDHRENCPRILLKGKSCSVVVRFSPYYAGQYNGRLKINLTGSQDVTVNLYGRGVTRF